MIPLFVDPSVLLLAVGGEHPLREPCRALLTRAGRDVRLHLSVEGGQEFLFHRLRRSDPGEATRLFDLLDRLVVWHDFDAEVLRSAVGLVRSGQVRGRDAVHVATARSAGFDAIVSCDRDFDAVQGFRRIDPADIP
ncbi:type II toxin-antitoxin system VapC family toxin [Actinomycetota bacterium]